MHWLTSTIFIVLCLLFAPAIVAESSSLTSSWYLRIDSSFKHRLSKVLKTAPYDDLLEQLPEALYYQDQRTTLGRPELVAGQLIGEVSVEIPGFGLAHLGFSSQSESDSREFWLIAPTKAKFLLAHFKAAWMPQPFLPLPPLPQHWLPIPGGALWLNEGLHLFHQYHDLAERRRAKTLDGKPILIPISERESIQIQVAVRRLNKDTVEPLWYVDAGHQKVALASCSAGKSQVAVGQSPSCARFDLVMYDFISGKASKIMPNLNWPAAFTNRGVYFENSRQVQFIEIDWELGGPKTEEPIKVYDLMENEIFKSRINEFTITSPNGSGQNHEYSLTPAGTLERYTRQGNRFVPIDFARHQKMEEFELDGSTNHKIDMLEELSSGARSALYGLPSIAEQLSLVLGGTKNTWAVLVYRQGQLPDDLVTDFVWRLKTNSVSASKNLSDIQRVYQFSWRHFDMPDADETLSRVQVVADTIKGANALAYFADFPAPSVIAASNNGADRLNTFSNYFGECVAEGTCRVLFTIREGVFNELQKSHGDIFRDARVIHIPPVGVKEAAIIADGQRRLLERKTNKRMTKIAKDNFHKFIGSDAYRVAIHSPEREVNAFTELFDYVATAQPNVSQVDDALVREWTENRGNFDLVRQKLDPALLCQGMKDRIVSHDEVVDSLCNLARFIKHGVRVNAEGPLAKYVFIGPSGTGKSFIPKVFSEFLYSAKDEMILVDMSNFKGISKGSPLHQAMTERGGIKVVTFDDIDQLRNPDTLNQLAEIMDTGFYAKGSENEIDFRNAIVFWTANWGQTVVNEGVVTEGSSSLRDRVRDFLTLTRDGQTEPTINPRVWGRIESGLHIIPRFSEPELIELAAVIAREKVENIDKVQGKQVRLSTPLLIEIAATEKNAKSGARAIEGRLVRLVFQDKTFQRVLSDEKIQRLVVLQNDDPTSESRVEVLAEGDPGFEKEWGSFHAIDLLPWHQKEVKEFVCGYLKKSGLGTGIPQAQIDAYLMKYDKN